MAEYDSAEAYFKQSIKIYERLATLDLQKFGEDLALLHHNFGVFLFSMKKDQVVAKDELIASLSVYKKLTDKNYILEITAIQAIIDSFTK